jgi:ketosteroid isomerase-like protein
MNAEEAARAWIEAWQRGWPAGDVDAIASRYTDGAVYSSHPFRPTETARSYLERAFGEEALVEEHFGEPVVAGDRAAVEYWGWLRSPSGRELTIAGTSVLRFDPEGRVTGHRDYWVEMDGRHDPPAGWGR